MLRSCLFLLAAYVLLIAAYAWWLGQMFDPPGQYIGAAIVALIVGGCLGTLYNARVAYREWSLVSEARAGLPWTDGRWTAVAGEIHPVGEPLIAPFSGQECVLCEYDVATRQTASAARQNENSKPGSDFAGFLMNPCVIRSDFGDVRLLGFPNLENFGERVCDGSDVASNARQFFNGTEFENYSGLKLAAVFSAITSAWSDDDGLVRKNLRLGKTMPGDLFPAPVEQGAMLGVQPQPELSSETSNDEIEDEEDQYDPHDEEEEDDADDEGLDDNFEHAGGELPLLKEKRVKVGEKVCAIGIYSGQRGGLIPGGLGADHFIKLFRGRAADIERDSRSSTFRRFFGGLIFLVLVNAAVYGVTLAARRDTRPATEEARRIVDGRGGNAARLKKLLGRGVDVNARDGQGRTLLMEAARQGNLDIVQVLIDAGADVNLRSNDGSLTALALAEWGGHAPVAELLRRAGATDDPPVAEQP
jgi:hypothetical protein